MTNVVIAGAAGRMGKALLRCGQESSGIQIVGGVEHAAHPELGTDLGILSGGDSIGIALQSELEPLLEQADVLIDFTLHAAVPVNAEVAGSLGRAVVIGTTGLTEEETQVVNRVANKVPIVWAPNMSIGVNLLFAMAERAASVLGAGYEVQISDTHHIHKQDAPSGTALRLGEKVAAGRNCPFEEVYVHDEGGQQETYPTGKIVIRSFREGEVVGDHTVMFDGTGEAVELTHRAKSRDGFALGALKAAEWVVRQRPRLYDMQDVLGLKQV